MESRVSIEAKEQYGFDSVAQFGKIKNGSSVYFHYNFKQKR